MTNYICTTCGVQYDAAPKEPAECIICDEERQYVSLSGQAWTTLEEMKQSGRFQNEITFEEERLYKFDDNAHIRHRSIGIPDTGARL